MQEKNAHDALNQIERCTNDLLAALLIIYEDDTETFCDQFAGEINKIEDAVREIRSAMK